MADRNTVPNSGVVNFPSDNPGNATEGMSSLSSPGGGHPRGINEAGSPIPTGYEGQSNGVRMPGPMSSGYELGWFFNDDGYDMSGVASSPPYIQGVQLPGVPAFESGWSFGADMSGMEQHQQEPPTNQNFGVFESAGPNFDGDDSIGGHVVGRMGNNYDMVQAGDIMAVFSAIVPDGGQGAVSQSGPVMGHDSMNGIVLGPGSGPYTGGEQNSFSTGPSPVAPSEHGSDGY